ncbi:MAG: hypothetical protein RL318_498 [Fibrobacterota bacterium]|jgi:phosphate transport system permease protein
MDTRKEIPEGLRRRFRPSDWIAAQIIRLVAVTSLIMIFLIMLFVVREAAPVLKTQSHHGAELSKSSTSSESGEESTPAGVESYGETPAVQETYGEDPASKDTSAATTAAVQDDPYGTPGGSMSADEIENTKVEEVPPFTFSNLFSTSWSPVSSQAPSFGIWPLIMGSLKVTFVSLLFAAPIGILAALYTTTFAPKWTRDFLKPIIEILAGIPTVVLGFFSLMILASLLQNIFGMDYRLNALVGGIGLSFTVIPIIFTLSDDAINAVPKYLTEGSLALGATKWETNFLVVLPAAIPGIFAALLLGLGRAFGETMIVLMATGNAAMLDPVLTNPVRTLSASIGAEMAEVVVGDLHYSVLFFLGVVLFAFSFALNAIAEFYIRARMMKRFKGI